MVSMEDERRRVERMEGTVGNQMLVEDKFSSSEER
jgi:hypothetical protein